MTRSFIGLPIFPLHDVVLLPGGLLPLHIFEPRYRAMVADAWQGNRLLAIARLQRGFEADYAGRPPVRDVIGVGSILSSEPLPDGRYNILVHGLARAKILHERPPNCAYRVVDAIELEELPADASKLSAEHDHCVALCRSIAKHLGVGGQKLTELLEECTTVKESLDMIAAAVVHDPDARQKLLETPCPVGRVNITSQHLHQILAHLRNDACNLN